MRLGKQRPAGEAAPHNELPRTAELALKDAAEGGQTCPLPCPPQDGTTQVTCSATTPIACRIKQNVLPRPKQSVLAEAKQNVSLSAISMPLSEARNGETHAVREAVPNLGTGREITPEPVDNLCDATVLTCVYQSASEIALAGGDTGHPAETRVPAPRLAPMLTSQTRHTASAGAQQAAFQIPSQGRFQPLKRPNRRPFHPSPAEGPYRLPHDVRDRLVADLAPFRNRDAALKLATFEARYWSTPSRIVCTGFPIDRRALANDPRLCLTEKQIRGGSRTLERVGFLDRAICKGSKHRLTSAGQLHRKVVLFTFGRDYAELFIAANKRAQAARARRLGERRALSTSTAPRPSVALPEVRPVKGPKSRSEATPQVLMGPVRREIGFLPEPSASNPLEAALGRLAAGVFGKGGSG